MREKALALFTSDNAERFGGAFSLLMLLSGSVLLTTKGLSSEPGIALLSISLAGLFGPWLAKQDTDRFSKEFVWWIMQWFGITFSVMAAIYVVIGLMAGVLTGAAYEIIDIATGGIQHGIPGMAPPNETLEDKVGTIIGAPIIEEAIYRHALFGGLMLAMIKVGVRYRVALFTALAYSSVMFALAHQWKTPLGWVFAAIAGTVFAVVYYYSHRNLPASMATHGSFNAFVVLVPN